VVHFNFTNDRLDLRCRLGSSDALCTSSVSTGQSGELKVSRRRTRYLITACVAVVVSLISLAQSRFEPATRYSRPLAELGKPSELRFLIPVTVSYAWAGEDESARVLLRDVGPMMLMSRDSNRDSPFGVEAVVLLEKWEYLHEYRTTVLLKSKDDLREVLLSPGEPPSRVGRGRDYLFAVEGPLPSEWTVLRDFPGVIEIDLKSDGCQVGDSVPKCRFVDFSGGDHTRNDWRNADLRLAQFDGSDLGSARFDGADLSGAIFIGANTNGASFEGSNLFGAIFE
jgi:hypothetical protein